MTGEIEALAAVVRAGVAEDERVAQGLLSACRKLGAVPDFFAAGGPAAEVFWQRFTEGRVLSEVGARRAMLDALLAEEHGVDEDGGSCPRTTRCTCGRDGRVLALLRHLAQPYQTEERP